MLILMNVWPCISAFLRRRRSFLWLCSHDRALIHVTCNHMTWLFNIDCKHTYLFFLWVIQTSYNNFLDWKSFNPLICFSFYVIIPSSMNSTSLEFLMKHLLPLMIDEPFNVDSIRESWGSKVSPSKDVSFWQMYDKPCTRWPCHLCFQWDSQELYPWLP